MKLEDEALQIINDFTTHPIDQKPYPFDTYCLKKLAALCERCAKAENAIQHTIEVDRDCDKCERPNCLRRKCEPY